MLLTLDTFKGIVTEKMIDLFDKEIDNAQYIANFLPDHLSYLKAISTTDGKKLRGYFTYLGAHCFPASDLSDESIYYLAASLEIFHSSILVIDDVMDQSSKRRGIESMHLYEQNRFGSPHVGESMTYCFAIAGAFFTNYLINQAPFSTNIRNSMSIILNRISIDLLYGQAYDIASAAEKDDLLTVEQIINICNLKTGLYTFLLPLQIGIIASGHEESMDIVKDFAKAAGIIYQLTDDILDIFGDIHLTGKENVCSDIKEGKINAITMLTINKASFEDREFLKQILGNYQTETFTHETTSRIQAIVTNSGALAQTNELIDHYTRLAEECLMELPINEEVKTILQTIVQSLKLRKK